MFNTKDEEHDPSLGFEPTYEVKKTSCWTAYYRVWMTLSVGLSFFALGMTSSSLSIIMAEIKRHIEKSAGHEIPWLGLVFLFTSRSVGYLAGYAACSMALSKFSFATFRSNCFFIVIVATALATVPLLDSLWKVYLVMAFIGLGCGWVEACGNTILIALFGDKVDIFMQSVHVAYGIGATGVPVLIQQTIRITDSFDWAIWAIAVTVALTGVVAIVASFGDVPEDDFHSLHPHAFQDPQGPRRNSYLPPQLRDRDRHQTMILVFSSVIIFLFALLHESMNSWWFSYATGASSSLAPIDQGQYWHITHSSACMLMSAYWGCFTLARILVKLQLYITPSLYLLVVYCAGAIFVGVLIFTDEWSTLLLWVLTSMIGFLNSGVFSAGLSLPGEMFIWVHRRDSIAFHAMATAGEIAGPITFGLLYFLLGSIFVVGEMVIMFALLYTTCSPLSKYVKRMKQPDSTFGLEDHPNVGYAPINVDLY